MQKLLWYWQQQRAMVTALAASAGYLLVKVIILPIQYDETVTILESSQYGPLAAFTRYAQGTNNHPLLSFFNGFLGMANVWHAWFFRLPSFIAAVLLLLAILALARSFLPPLWRAVALGLLIATPLASDYLVMDRGYVLGIACIAWMTVLLADALAEREMSTKRMGGIGLLSGLAIISVPSYLLDAIVLCFAFVVIAGRMRMLGSLWKQLVCACGIAIVLVFCAYIQIASTVITKVFGVASSGVRFWAEVWRFIDAMTVFPTVVSLVLGGIVALYAAWLLLGYFRKPDTSSPVIAFLCLVFLLSLPCATVGVARCHLLVPILGILLVLFFLSHRQKQHLSATGLLVYALFAVAVNPWIYIRSEPEVKSVTGLSVALHALHDETHAVNCVLVQSRGIYLLPYEFYQRQGLVAPATNDCPYVFLEKNGSIAVVARFELYPNLLDPYGVALFKIADIRPYLSGS